MLQIYKRRQKFKRGRWDGRKTEVSLEKCQTLYVFEGNSYSQTFSCTQNFKFDTSK